MTKEATAAHDWTPKHPFVDDHVITHVTLAEREVKGRKAVLGLHNNGARCYEQPGNGFLLKGWKTIAQYFCVSIPTARKYHDDWGMPVIRFMHKKGVWTTTGSLDNWITELSKMQQKKVKIWNERNPEIGRRKIRTYFKLRE